MKTLIAASALLTASITIAAMPASAQNAPVYQYCLLDGSHPNTAGMVLCRFETIAQCLASRNSFNDTCYVNPQFAGRRK